MNLKQISQEFKTPREQVVDAVLKQKEHLKQLQQQIKQLKRDVWHAQLPVWQQQVAVINNIHTVVIELEHAQHEELKEISKALEKNNVKFSILLSKQEDGRLLLFATVSPDYVSKVNLTNLASWLKETQNIKCGASKNTLQGGAEKFDAQLKEKLLQWVKRT